MSSLGNRLETVISLLEKQGNTLFADIGSDHAFLAIEAVRRGIAEKAVAADVNYLPLEKGRENAEANSIDVEFVLSDGFDALDGREITSAAVCGMGGELIAKIVLRSRAAHKCLLVLQPMSAQEELRKALWENGFEIHTEKFTVESGKPYAILQASYAGVNTEYCFNDLFLGKTPTKSPEFRQYCEKILNSALKRRAGLAITGKDTKDIDGLIKECQAQITSL